MSMRKIIIRATIDSIVFALCFTGIITLIYFIKGDRLSNEEVLLRLPLAFVGWFIWTIIDTYILKHKK